MRHRLNVDPPDDVCELSILSTVGINRPDVVCFPDVDRLQGFSRGWDMHNRDTALVEVVGTQHQQLVSCVCDRLHSTRKKKGRVCVLGETRALTALLVPPLQWHETAYCVQCRRSAKLVSMTIGNQQVNCVLVNGRLNREECLFVQGRPVL